MLKFLDLPLDNGVVTQIFGVNRENYIKFNLQGHHGLDFAAPCGTPVYLRIHGVSDDGTARNGIATCVFAGPKGDDGNTVIVHVDDDRLFPGGFLLLFSHLESMSCVTGIGVANGMQIGTVGNTGRSTGDHLHLSFAPLAKKPNMKSLPINWRSCLLDPNNGFKGWTDCLAYFTRQPQILPNAGDPFVIPGESNDTHFMQTVPPTEPIKKEQIVYPDQNKETKPEYTTTTSQDVEQKKESEPLTMQGLLSSFTKGGLYHSKSLIIKLAILVFGYFGIDAAVAGPLVSNILDNAGGLATDAHVVELEGNVSSNYAVIESLQSQLNQLSEQLAEQEMQARNTQPLFVAPQPTPTPQPIVIVPDEINCHDVTIAGGWNLREGPGTDYAVVRFTIYPNESFCVSYPATPNGWFQIQEGVDEGLYISPKAFIRG